MDVQTLDALWMVLCIKVEKGTLTVEKATHIFELARQIVVRKRLKEQEKDEKKGYSNLVSRFVDMLSRE